MTKRGDLMARVDLFAKIPLIGMSMVFLAMFIVAVTAYLHVGWWSILGYAIAAAWVCSDLRSPSETSTTRRSRRLSLILRTTDGATE